MLAQNVLPHWSSSLQMSRNDAHFLVIIMGPGGNVGSLFDGAVLCDLNSITFYEIEGDSDALFKYQLTNVIQSDSKSIVGEGLSWLLLSRLSFSWLLLSRLC